MVSRRRKKPSGRNPAPVLRLASELSIRQQTAIVSLLLAAYVVLAVWNASTTSPTQDEPVHLAAGFMHLSGDFRLNPEHPPLVKMLAALPLRMSGEYRIDPMSGEPLSASSSESMSNDVLRWEWNGVAARGEYWRLVHELFYGVKDHVLVEEGVTRASELRTDRRYAAEDHLHDPARQFLRSRLVVLSFGVLLGLIVWQWSREMFGALPAVMSLAVFAFDPNFIGHGALVTTDVPAAAAIVASVYAFWRVLRHGGWKSEVAYLVALALAATVKHSTVLLAPTLAAIGLVWVIAPRVVGSGFPGPRARVLRIVRLLLLGGVAAILGIWAVYGFRFSAVKNVDLTARLERETRPDVLDVPFREPGTLPIEWTLRLAAADRELLDRWPDGAPMTEVSQVADRIQLPAIERAILSIHQKRLLPEGYLMGLAHVRFSSLRGAFLSGEYSNVGFPDYFIKAFLYKTSLPVLALIVVMALTGLARSSSWSSRGHLLLLLLPVAVYGFVAFRSTLNIGHRHLLPIYPFLFVAIGSLAAGWLGRSGATVVRRVALAASVVALSSVLVFNPLPGSFVPPHHLSYFNELAGGPVGGNRHLVDSNCDWGQDLPALAGWIRRNAADEIIHLCYFGSGDPRGYGITFVNMVGGYPEAPLASIDPRDVSGIIAISATHLRGVTWTPELRAVWKEALADATFVGRAGYSILIFRK